MGVGVGGGLIGKHTMAIANEALSWNASSLWIVLFKSTKKEGGGIELPVQWNTFSVQMTSAQLGAALIKLLITISADNQLQGTRRNLSLTWVHAVSDEGNRIPFLAPGEMFTRPNKGDRAACFPVRHTGGEKNTGTSRLNWRSLTHIEWTDAGKRCIINQRDGYAF